jgi:hypothetical protein
MTSQFCYQFIFVYGFLILLSNQVRSFELNSEIRYSTVKLFKRKQGHRQGHKHPNKGQCNRIYEIFVLCSF